MKIRRARFSRHGVVHSDGTVSAQQSGQVTVHDQRGEHDGDRGAQLDQDVQRWTGGVLERVTHGVADDGGLVAVRALATVTAALDGLLGIILGIVYFQL